MGEYIGIEFWSATKIYPGGGTFTLSRKDFESGKADLLVETA